MGMERSAFKMGFFGAGALWCLREPEGTYITFNNVRIARREEDGTWMVLQPGWKVTPVGTVAVRIQQNDDKSAIMPFRGGVSKMTTYGYAASPQTGRLWTLRSRP
jgi:hypothetical protein